MQLFFWSDYFFPNFPHDPTFAIWAMRDAFEERFVESELVGQDYHVIGAAQFILWDGPERFKHALCPNVTKEDNPDWAPGRLYFGGYRLSLTRWNRWKKGFRHAMEEGRGLGEECRRAAKKKAALMVAIEESLTF